MATVHPNFNRGVESKVYEAHFVTGDKRLTILRISEPAPTVIECNRDVIAGFAESGWLGALFIRSIVLKFPIELLTQLLSDLAPTRSLNLTEDVFHGTHH